MTSIKGVAWTRASSCLDLIKCPGNLNKFLEEPVESIKNHSSVLERIRSGGIGVL